MKSKYYIGILFLLASLSSCSTTKTKEHHQVQNHSTSISSEQCVEAIIKQDAALGKIRNHACEKISLSETIRDYTNALQGLDFTACNTEITQAFKDHITAWNNMIIITDNHSSLRGEMHDLFDQIELSRDKAEFKIKLDAIWETWAVFEELTKLEKQSN